MFKQYLKNDIKYIKNSRKSLSCTKDESEKHLCFLKFLALNENIVN